MSAAAHCAEPTPKHYQRRRPERTLWYLNVQTHLETCLERASGEAGVAPPVWQWVLEAPQTAALFP